MPRILEGAPAGVPPAAVSDRQLLAVGVWFGLITGFAEVGLWLVRRAHPGTETLYYGLDFGWLSPVATVIIFSGAATALAALRRVGVRRIALTHAAFLFTALAAFGPLFTFHPRLHKGSSALIALGLASVVARAVRARPAALPTTVRRTLPLFVAGVLAAAVLAQVPVAVSERRAFAALPTPPAPRPNVLLITLDTVGAHHMSVYGYDRPTTPRLQELAKRGVVFDRALAPTSWTLPSHSSLFTGRQPKELSSSWTVPLDKTAPTLAEVLASQGYATAGFVANVTYASRVHGLNRGFAHYEDHVVSLGQLAESASLARFITDSGIVRDAFGFHDLLARKKAPALNQSILDWLSVDRGRPFFVFANYFDAHGPFVPPEPYATEWKVDWKLKPTRPQLLFDWSPAQVAAERNSYDAALAYLDEQVGRLLNALEARGTLRNTLVVVTSDHGEEFYEHGAVGHGANLHVKPLHVPLIMFMPHRLPAGERVAPPISLADVPATVLELVGADEQARSRLAGRSLLRLWSNEGEGRHAEPAVAQEVEPVWGELSHAPNLPDHFPLSKGDMRSLVSGRFHYIRQGDGEEQLYDIEADPDEQQNLAPRREQQQVLSDLRNLVRARESRLVPARRGQAR